MGVSVKKFFSILGSIMAFLTIALLAFLFIEAQFKFVDNTKILDILLKIKEYAVIATISVVALEFASTKGLILFIVVAALIAVVVIFSFFPNVQQTLLSYVK